MSNQRAIVDVVCKAGITNLATEIGALLGQELTCSAIQLEILSKETLFSDPAREKTILTRIDVAGDQSGDCFLLTRLDTAITLGGTLIMLPEEMIREQIAAGKLDGEMPDAFGEVANIIAGVFTQAFVDKYPQSIRFVKKTVEELIPSKIDIAGDEPFPPGNYYRASCVLSIGDNSLGPVEFIVPTAVFALEAADAEAAQQSPAETAVAVEAEVVAKPDPIAAPAPPAEKLPAFAEAKKLTDVIFKATINQLGGEMGALLGKDLACADIKLEMVKKSGFFSEYCLEKSAMSLVKISGDRNGCGFLFVQIPDAIILGGTLIMLPEDQIAEQVEKFAFEGESVDAYGEIANILCGALTQVFLDRYPKQLRFVRTETEVLVPTKLDPEADEPFPEGDYYLASFSIGLEGYQLNRMSLLFPGEVFDLYPGQLDTATGSVTQATAAEATTEPAAVETAKSASGSSDAPIVLLISERQNEAAPFVEILSSSDCTCKVLSFQDDIKTQVRQHQLLGIFLIMSQVSEKGFATAIKLQSLGKPAPPLIFVGPDWTRSTVMRAVKYGARDILMLPASDEEIQEKISHHILKAS